MQSPEPNVTDPARESSGNLSPADPYWGGGLLKNPVEFREWFKILFRVWRPAMSPHQFLVVMFIFDRTAAWGKEWEIITQRHFLQGVHAKDGREYASGLVTSHVTLRASLAYLIDAGAVAIRPVSRARTAYSLVYEWNPNLTNETDTMSLAKPKRLHALQTDETQPEGKATLPLEGKATLPQRKEKGNAPQKQRDCSAIPASGPGGQADDLALSLSLAACHSRNCRTQRLAKWGADSATAFWLDQCRAAFPDAAHLAITKTDAAILAKYGRRWMVVAKNRDVAALHEFLAWVIARWLVIREAHFAWMRQASPGVPSIRFVVKFSDRYEGAWEERDATERMASLDSAGREVARRVRRGMNEEVAKAEVDRKLGTAKELAALEAARRKVDESRRIADAEERQREADRTRAAAWRKPPAASRGSFDDWE